MVLDPCLYTVHRLIHLKIIFVVCNELNYSKYVLTYSTYSTLHLHAIYTNPCKVIFTLMEFIKSRKGVYSCIIL